MSVNVNALPAVTELNASDKIPAVINSSNEGRAITLANLGAQVAGAYTASAFCGVLPSGTDLNDVTTPGVYFCSGSNQYTNLPPGLSSGAWGILEVIGYAATATTLCQSFTGMSAHRCFRRMITTSGPKAWFELGYAALPDDTISLVSAGRAVFIGTVQDSQTQIRFTVPCPMALAAISTVTVASLGGLYIRPLAGGSIYYGTTAMGNLSLTTLPSGMSVAAEKGGAGIVNIKVNGENQFLSASGGTALTNFSAVQIYLSALTVTVA